MKVAIVLHAHLPYVGAERPWTVEERWFHDALWTCYLPLLEVVEEGPMTVSLSPPLIEMLRDEVLATRFVAHLDALDELNEAHRDRTGEVGAFYARRIAGARTRWLHHRGDVVGRLGQHWKKGHVELWTTGVTHGFLPGLAVLEGAVEAQVRLGQRVFHDALGAPPDGFWLPECGIDTRVARRLAGDARCSLVDAHAIEAGGTTSDGLVLWPRHLEASHRVWSRERGYPRHALYREFHRDLGHELDAGPFGHGTMTGLKPYAIDGELYRAREAEVQAKRDAADFVRWLDAQADTGRASLVTAYDAELFGHWWFEGPVFLREVLAGLSGHPRLTPVTVSALEPTGKVVPEASSWGRGGDHAVWVGPRTAHLWRHVHGTSRQLRRAVQGLDPDARDTPAARGIDHALRQGLLLQASDWAFALEDGSAADYARRRIRQHRGGVREGLDAARTGDASRLPDPARGGFLSRLRGEALRAPFRG